VSAGRAEPTDFRLSDYFATSLLSARHADTGQYERRSSCLHQIVRPNLTEAVRARFAGMLRDHGASLDLRDDLLQSTQLGGLAAGAAWNW
jgi:hypothetical protein